MLTLTICRGLPGSGKSTWALEQVKKDKGKTVRVNRDTLRLMFGVEYNHHNEGLVASMRDMAIIDALKAGKNVICDDTNLTAKHFRHFQDLPSGWSQQIHNQVDVVLNDSFMDVSVEECIRRDVQRKEGRCGKDVIERMYYDYWEHQDKPANAGSNFAVLCDIDGTLALLPEGMSYPKAFDRDYRNDRVNTPVLMLLESLHDASGDEIILMSGRFSERLDETQEWLKDNHVPHDQLLCRKEGDRRQDTIVKKELYLEHIQGKYQVDFVLDDRPSVVRMWRAELGLTVFQVGPNLEF